MAGEFLITLGDARQIPELFQGGMLQGRGEPRMCMVGRSNVGKSSLINALLGTRIARISKEPGKTRSIHFYLWKELSKIVADLPGYGYARVSHSERERWANFINRYLKCDGGLERALVLLDARHGPTNLDRQAIDFLSLSNIPVTFVFTKFDTLKTQKERAARRKEAGAALRELGCDPDSAIWASSKTGDGLREIVKAISYVKS